MMMMRARMKLKPTGGAPSRKIHRNQKVKTSVPGYLKPDLETLGKIFVIPQSVTSVLVLEFTAIKLMLWYA